MREMNAMSGQFVNKVVLVTGGGQGIGKAAALRFAEEGAQVAVSDRRGAGRAVVDGINARGGRALYVRADIARATDVEAMVAAVIDRFGRLDCALNNAGCGLPAGRIADHDDTAFDEVVAVNLRGTFLCMKHEIRQFLKQGGGSIVNVSSAAGLGPVAKLAGYCASKSGVIALTKVAAVEYARDNIRVNVICPGLIDTPLLHMAMPTAEMIAAAAGGASPMARLGDPIEVANTAVWLCSDQSSFVTGIAMPVDGGQRA
jgi:NAD(P)-dependent dehydrogenase (short-subunit alcohol dehydrogenase family)